MTETPKPTQPAVGAGSSKSEALLIGPQSEVLLDRWMSSGAGRPIVVEPDPTLAENHRVRANVCVVEAAIGQESGKAQLTSYNIPDLRSIHPPAAALKAAYPGLRVLNQQEVEVLPLAQILTPRGPKRSSWRQSNRPTC